MRFRIPILIGSLDTCKIKQGARSGIVSGTRLCSLFFKEYEFKFYIGVLVLRVL